MAERVAVEGGLPGPQFKSPTAKLKIQFLRYIDRAKLKTLFKTSSKQLFILCDQSLLIERSFWLYITFNYCYNRDIYPHQTSLSALSFKH